MSDRSKQYLSINSKEGRFQWMLRSFNIPTWLCQQWMNSAEVTTNSYTGIKETASHGGTYRDWQRERAHVLSAYECVCVCLCVCPWKGWEGGDVNKQDSLTITCWVSRTRISPTDSSGLHERYSNTNTSVMQMPCDMGNNISWRTGGIWILFFKKRLKQCRQKRDRER